MSTEVQPGTLDSTNSTNYKVVAETPAMITSHGFRLLEERARMSVDHANRLNIIAEAGISRAQKNILEPDAEEAVSAQKYLSGNDLGQIVASLGAAIGALQGFIKGGQTVPPVTP